MSAAIAEYEAYQVEFAACCDELDQQSPEEMAALVGNIAENKSFKKKLDSLENHRKMFWAIVAEKSPEWDI